MIEIKNLQKSFGPKQVLKNVNLQIEDGQVLCILGGSGCGKSTLIKCLMRLEEADGGQILVDGKDVTKIHSEVKLASIRRHFGYLFQEGALFDSMSVGENVAFGLKYLTDVPEADYPKVVKEKLALVGLKDVEHLNPSELSGGMKKRVGLARALAMQPQMVFYDEPTSGLDPVMTMTISRLIRKTQQTLGVTSVLVTHDMESAYYAADRIAMLYNNGRIVQIGTVAEIKNSTNPIVKAFINGTELKEEEKDEQQ